MSAMVNEPCEGGKEVVELILSCPLLCISWIGGEKKRQKLADAAESSIDESRNIL